jgi:NADH dehydrogenase
MKKNEEQKKDSLRPIRIVIIGAGFGGIYTYLELHKELHAEDIEVILINETDRFEFIPMIHEVATGTLQPSAITQSVRTVPQCCLQDFIEGAVIGIDADRKNVTVCQDTHDIPEQYADIPAHKIKEIPYDFLVIATGSETNYFGVPGAREHTFPLKTLSDATTLKNKLIERFEQAQHLVLEEDIRDTLRFIIVGGGPTGVEIAGELSDVVSSELSDSFPEVAQLASVVIIERGAHLLGALDKSFGKKAERIISAMPQVYVLCGTEVRGVTRAGVETPNGILKSATVIWAAGVRARTIKMLHLKPIERDLLSNRLRVTETLSLPSYKSVFVVGDQAYIENKDNLQPYPMRAQFAVREGKVVGKNIAHSVRGEALEAFEFKERGFIISIGKRGALAQIFGMHFSGFLAWVIYRGAYLFAIIGARAKFRTGLEWMLNIFLPRDISKR